MDFAYAVAIAARAYGANRNSSGALLLSEALEVVRMMEPAAPSAATSAAVLHRVPNHTHWTVKNLADVGTEPVVCEAIDALARRDGETYVDYIRRVCGTPGQAGEMARLVLVADLRLGIASTDSDALRERYASSLPLVQSALAPVG